MSLPKVAIVGRPNVGKSSLFNWLAGIRISIVEPTPGVTRDRLSTPIELEENCWVELIDTGGMGVIDKDNLTEDVEKQIFVGDARDGVLPLDELVAQKLRHIQKPVLMVVNKCDVDKFESNAQEFRQFGYEPFLMVSACQGRGRAELLEAIRGALPQDWDDLRPPAEADLKLAIVGRRNVGKSTFINALAKEERVIVSEVAGTTRDSIDVRIERDGKAVIAIDTAGVRRKSSIADSIEFYSLARAERSIRRADVVLLFFDAEQTTSIVDKQLVTYITENYKPAIFVVNKWDLLKKQGKLTGEWGEYLRKTFPALEHVPIAFTTAMNQRNVQKVLNLAQALHKQAQSRVSTSKLNDVLRRAIERKPPTMRHGKIPKLYYATQTDVCPPTMILFTNGHDVFSEPYQRYLLKALRDELPFTEVPIRFMWRVKGDEPIPEVEEEKPQKPRRIHSPPQKKPNKQRSLRALEAEQEERRRAVRQSKKPAKWKDEEKRESDIWRDV
ncbi:MAG TPA: ribosome biogenesis GTPase Der [Gemmatales bacterium]|nr:ribosome biogenesis GTPase Der [Gemmatales bacterium]